MSALERQYGQTDKEEETFGLSSHSRHDIRMLRPTLHSLHSHQEM